MDTLLRFLAALAVGAAGGALFWSIHAPLPWVLGSMAACAVASVAGLPIQASAATRRPMAAVIGVVLGSSFGPHLLPQARDWIIPLAALPFFLATAALLCVTYFRKVAKFDPATAYFAGMPGGIAEMVVMGAERGADERAIGLIHGARIFLVVFILPFLIRLDHAPVAASAITPVTGDVASWSLLFWGLGCALLGLLIGRLLRLPAWHLVGPLAVSAAVHMSGLADFRIPGWALAAAQVGLGATMGCRFVGLTLKELLRILALAAGSTAILLAVTFAWAAGIGTLAGVDPVLLTLAYSPGGLAEMSMVALSLALEPGVVVIHHLTRVILVLICAPLGFASMGRKSGAD
ncbi:MULTISPECIES: AbrB family transcriptional regulator [Sphingobium]|uniref:Monooxygenase n=1 Tax=Sphingobium yanoikuyae TaxID=13690 RepID=A0A0J9D109_SPHYA|nr:MULTISPECIES: AbrB family transcriptional regulator [Sphingobium]ATP20707.1 monooxygenase [Sphingobium yanoikuyae]KMW31047.1 monooxygenase [Sphingobium yanoikuyae]